MKKSGVVAALAAAAALAGCLDPQYKSRRSHNAPPPPPPPIAVPDSEPVTPAPNPPPPIVVDEVKPLPPPVNPPPPVVVDTPPPAPATTTYIVQRGDSLSKISKRFNITIAAIRRMNPQLKGDALRIGQKLELPGAVDVGEQKRPVRSFQSNQTAGFKKYTGETRDYTVVAGDSLSKIAHQTGCTVAQLADLNGLERDTVRIGQKLRVPAKKPVVAAAPAKAKPADKLAAKPAPAPVADKQPVRQDTETPVKADEAPAPEKIDDAAAPAPDVPAGSDKDVITYKVNENDDLSGLSITFDVSPARLRQLNGLGENEELTPGMVIKIPASPN